MTIENIATIATEMPKRPQIFILQTPSFTGDTLIVDSGEHLTGRPRDVAFDRKGKA